MKVSSHSHQGTYDSEPNMHACAMKTGAPAENQQVYWKNMHNLHRKGEK